ncbi:MAG: metal ABC transporter substrate-binding protein [Oscillospiraceae bacterium]|jgi:zinc transport system substrate-binding protein|nr:metal ABC transporter substrate-binding protein [Oscillospiraceae bacterium]
MKKIFSILCVVCLAVMSFTACGTANPAQTSDDPAKISVVATIFPQYDFVRAIAGDKVNLTMLLPPGSESHSYEPTTRDITNIQSSDLFIYVGGESDEWIADVLDSMDQSKMQILTLMDCVDVVEEVLVEGMEEEEEEAEEGTEEGTEEGEGEEAPEYDEHVWTSPKNAKLIVEKITAALVALDEANADAYLANKTAYLAKLDDLDAQFQSVVDNAARKTIVFGDRFPFRYFADAYGLDYYAAFPGCSTETEPSAATVRFLIDKIKAENIPVVFHIELANEQMAETISESTGAKVLLLHACHNISKDDFTAGVTYLDLMTGNVSALREALA